MGGMCYPIKFKTMDNFQTLEDSLVPYEIALVLKQKDFNEPCFGFYDEGTLYLDKVNGAHEYYVLAPTYTQVLHWLRKTYNIEIIIADIEGMTYEGRLYAIEVIVDDEMEDDIIDLIPEDDDDWYLSYKDAHDEGIKIALDLI